MMTLADWLALLRPFGIPLEVGSGSLTYLAPAADVAGGTLTRRVARVVLVVDELTPLPDPSPVTPFAHVDVADLADWAPGELTEGFGS